MCYKDHLIYHLMAGSRIFLKTHSAGEVNSSCRADKKGRREVRLPLNALMRHRPGDPTSSIDCIDAGNQLLIATFPHCVEETASQRMAINEQRGALLHTGYIHRSAFAIDDAQDTG